MEADRFGLVRQIIGIDADAVAADEAGAEGLEVPLGAGRLEHLARLEAELLEQHGELVDQCDVHVALDVLDDLGGLGDADRARAMGAGGDDRGIDGVDRSAASGVEPEVTLTMSGSRWVWSPGLMRSGE